MSGLTMGSLSQNIWGGSHAEELPAETGVLYWPCKLDNHCSIGVVGPDSEAKFLKRIPC